MEKAKTASNSVLQSFGGGVEEGKKKFTIISNSAKRIIVEGNTK